METERKREPNTVCDTCSHIRCVPMGHTHVLYTVLGSLFLSVSIRCEHVSHTVLGSRFLSISIRSVHIECANIHSYYTLCEHTLDVYPSALSLQKERADGWLCEQPLVLYTVLGSRFLSISIRSVHIECANIHSCYTMCENTLDVYPSALSLKKENADGSMCEHTLVLYTVLGSLFLCISIWWVHLECARTYTSIIAQLSESSLIAL